MVDDNVDSRDMLSAMLRDYGARVRVLGSVDEAWRLIEGESLKLDVLVSDLGIPENDGYELIRRVRASHSDAVRGMPAIAVTGYANPEDRLRALTAGYQAHIAKPIDPAFVAAWIANLVKAEGRSTR